MYLMQKQVKSRIVSLYQDFEYLLENENLWNPKNGIPAHSDRDGRNG